MYAPGSTGAGRDQKRVFDFLGLELQVIIWVLELELKSSARVVHTLNPKVFFLVLCTLQQGTNKAQQRKITWPQLLFITNKYESQGTRPGLCCER